MDFSGEDGGVAMIVLLELTELDNSGELTTTAFGATEMSLIGFVNGVSVMSFELMGGISLRDLGAAATNGPDLTVESSGVETAGMAVPEEA